MLGIKSTAPQTALSLETIFKKDKSDRLNPLERILSGWHIINMVDDYDFNNIVYMPRMI